MLQQVKAFLVEIRDMSILESVPCLLMVCASGPSAAMLSAFPFLEYLNISTRNVNADSTNTTILYAEIFDIFGVPTFCVA